MAAVVHAVGLFSAAMWYALQQLHITVESPTPFPPDADRATQIELYVAHLQRTLPQQYGALLIAAVAFAGLYLLAEQTASVLGARRAGALIRLGAGLYITAQLIQAGGYRYLATNTATPSPRIEAQIVGQNMVDAIDDALEVGAYTGLGLGILVLAVATWTRPSTRHWSRLSAVVASIYIALAATTAVEAWALVDPILALGGIVVGPTWAVWLGLLLRDRGRLMRTNQRKELYIVDVDGSRLVIRDSRG